MKKKTVLVTGGNSGLGYAIARKFCDAGYKVYIIGRNEEKTRQAADNLGELVVPIVFNLNNLEAIPKLIDELLQATGKIDVLVNNAGINMKKDFSDVSDDEFDSILHTNVKSVFAISREVVKSMKVTNGGNIVNISSMAAQYGIPQVIAYTASKTAIEGMTRAMAVDLAQHHIRVNCVAPGFIKTHMTAKALDSDKKRKERVFARTPMDKMGRPEDIADAVFYLAGNEASFITGTVLCVDGGNAIGF